MRWTQQAADDLATITEHIALDSMHYAPIFAVDVLAAVDRLEAFPLLGKVVPETAEHTIGELLLGNYRTVYRVGDHEVTVLTLYHGARLLAPRLLR